MVNEGCITGCPNRYGHAGEFIDRSVITKNKIMSGAFYKTQFCDKLEYKYPFLVLVKANIIYPWEIEEYSKIGINKFKLVGRDSYNSGLFERFNQFRIYLKGIDNYKNIENIPINDLIHRLTGNYLLNKLSVKEVRKYLPNINHFQKYGHLCFSNCEINCNYCFKCAKEIEKIYIKNQELKKKKINVIKTVYAVN